MCWCEQISPLAHSSQATWQPFNLSHCTIPTCWAAQDNLVRRISHIRLRFDSAQSASDCQQTMAAIARILYVTSHSLQHQWKNGNCRDEWYISWYKCSWQVDTTIVPNPILYFYSICRKCRNLSYLKCDSRICHREAHPTLVKRSHARAGRACVKPFLFPVKSRRYGLADFNT